MKAKYISFLLIFIAFNLSGQKDPSYNLLSKVNQLRAQGCVCNGNYMPSVGPVSWNATLEKSARVHAADMAKNNYFSHFSRSGLDVGDRVEKLGYNWQTVGENLAQGYYEAGKVLQAWIDSPEHCELLMNPKFTEMGAALRGEFWVQHFGKQRKPRD